MKRRQFVGASALAAASLGALRVPLVGAQNGVEVTWSSWGNTGEVANLQSFTDDYNASQSEVVANYIPVPTDGYDTKLLTQLNGGTAPDLFYAGDGQVSTLVKNNVVADHTELLTSDASKSRPEPMSDCLGCQLTAIRSCFGTTRPCFRKRELPKCLPIPTRQATGTGKRSSQSWTQ
jgi:ABC-type glycerol-3-phosphate transport system substrate-binding protein